jgi:DNA-directed RNA polymerase specialized sigma24 family protein
MVAARATGAAVAGADLDRDQAELRVRELYRANFRPVHGYAVNRLGAADDVPDVVAEVFTIAWRRLADIPPPPADRFRRAPQGM